MKFCLASRHFLPLKSKYSLQHPVLKHPQFLFSFSVRDQDSNPYKTRGNITLFYVVRQEAAVASQLYNHATARGLWAKRAWQRKFDPIGVVRNVRLPTFRNNLPQLSVLSIKQHSEATKSFLSLEICYRLPAAVDSYSASQEIYVFDTGRFIAAITKAHHMTFFWVCSFQFTSLQPTCLTFILMLYSALKCYLFVTFCN